MNRRRPTHATVVAYLALFVALGGTSLAAFKLPAHSVGKRELKKNAVTTGAVKNHSLRTVDFAKGTLLRGPQGVKGDRGLTGLSGAPGTARAYGTVDPASCTPGNPEVCSVEKAKGITAVTRINTGSYCITAPGLSSETERAITTIDWSTTQPPGTESSATAMSLGGAGCPNPTTDFGVVTARPTVPPPGNTYAGDIGFEVMIP